MRRGLWPYEQELNPKGAMADRLGAMRVLEESYSENRADRGSEPGLRRPVMASWGAFVCASNVIPLRARGSQ